MTTQYTPTLKLALPVTGELSGTWGDTVNDNITSMIEQAIAGLSTINTWTANAHTLTTANGTTSESRCAMLVAATGGGAPTAAADIICPAAAKLYVLQNNTSFAVTLKTSAGTGVAVAAGDTAFLFCDATNVNSCVTTIVNGNITGNLTVGGNATINGNTTLGNATSDTITATARFNTDLVPSTDNARDLGSAANSWKDLFIDGTATMALVAISGGTINGVSIGATTAATLINVDNLRLDGNTLSSTDTNGNVVIAPNGTGDVQLDADTVRVGDAAAAATLTSNGAGALTVTTGGAADLTLSTNSGTTSGTVVIANGANGNITLTPDGTGDVILSADRVQMGDSNTDTTLTTNGTGSLNLTTNNGTNSGTVQIAQGVNGNITLTPNGTGSVSISKLYSSGNTILGATSANTLSVAATITSNLLFTDATYDIGASGATRPRDLFLSRNLTVGGTLTLTGGVNLNGNVTVGDSSADTLTINSTVTSNLIFTDNTYDIGASGATRPRTGYFGTSLITPLIDATNVEVTNIKALDGTASITLADSTGVASFTANPILSGGTANGVLYLNGSKSATSGTALVFDGTNLGIGSTSPATYGRLDINQATDPGTTPAALSVRVVGVGGGTAVPQYGINVDAAQSYNNSTILYGIKVVAAQNIGSTTYGVHSTTNPGNSTVNRWAIYGKANVNADATHSLSTLPVGVYGEAQNTTGTGNVSTSAAGYFLNSSTLGDTAYGVYIKTTAGPTTPVPLRIDHASSELLRITSAGNVGIGTSSPGQKLAVHNSATNAEGFRVLQTTGGRTSGGALGLFYDDQVGTTQATLQVIQNGTGDILQLDDGGTRVVTVKDGGNVGIGTTNPAAKLEVSIATLTSGEIARFSSPSYDSVYIAAGASATSAGIGTVSTSAFNLFVNSTSRLIVTNAGLVGIGNSSPTGKLDVTGRTYIRASGVDQVLTLINQSGGDGSITATGTSNTMNYGFSTYSTSNALYIENGGNVGIGTASPSYKLHVRGADATANLVVGNTTEGTQFEVLTYQDDRVALRATDTSNVGRNLAFEVGATEVGRFTSAGDFCVGTTSSNSSLMRVAKSNQGRVFYVSQDAATNIETASIYQTVSGGNNNQPIGLVVAIEAQGTGDRIYTGQYWNGGTPQTKFYVQRDGTVANSTGTYGTISDIRAKQDITDASSQWEDVKKIKFRKFRLIDDVNKYAEKAIYMMGPIAQELEEAGMKGLVETPVDKDGNETDLQKTVKLSIMHMKGMKALQEAMARIEQLEARLAAANL